MSIKSEIFQLINQEADRQEYEIELIASENYVSKDVLLANGSILTNKYSEGYPGKRYYAWQIFIDQIETLAINSAKELFGAEYANVQPLSGSPANLAAYSAFIKPGDTVLGMSLDHGGHLTHWHPLNESGRLYHFVSYGVDLETEIINMDNVRQIALESKPKLIVAGFSAYSRSLDWARFRQIADEVGAILMADISHIAGLIAGKQLENPIPFCDVVTTTTHKTLRGPRWAIILAKEKYSKELNRAVFPGCQGWPHEHTIAAKAIAFSEANTEEFKIYTRQVIDNARHMANVFISRGVTIVSGGTDNHLFCINVNKTYNIGWKEAENILEFIWISVNKNMIPFDTRKPLDPSGIRIWTPAVTTRWMKEKEMDLIVDIIDTALKNPTNEWLHDELKQNIRNICEKFPIYK